MTAIHNAKLPAYCRAPGDKVFKGLVIAFSSGIILLAVSMAVILWLEALPTFRKFGFLHFIQSTTWDPVRAVHGAFPFIIGTLITSFGALLLAVVPALGLAVFTVEYAPKPLALIINYTVDLLASIPSVVIGLWAVFTFAPWMREVFYLPIYDYAAANLPWLLPIIGAPSNYNLVTATVILALMIVPYTVALARDAIRLVPADQREAAWALGATRVEVIFMAVLPYARTGITAGILLSLARALGETMAVAMLIGNANRLPFTLFGPAATMPSLIINEFREAVEPLHYTSIMGIGFLLFLLTICINLLAAWIQQRLMGKQGRIQ